MANVEYANPFGSYVKGQQAGQEATINEGMAARRFRAADLSPEVQAWYGPLIQREMAARAGTGELGLNEGLFRNAAQLTSLGSQGDDYFRAMAAKLYGFDPNLIQGGGTDPQSQQIDLQRRAGAAAGNTPYGLYDPILASVSHGGVYNKEQQLTPEQYQQRMSLQYGPNWQSGQGGAPSANGYNSYNNPNASPWIQQNTTAAATMGQPSGSTQNPAGGVQYNTTGNTGAGRSQFMIDKDNVPGFNNIATHSGQNGLPALPGDNMNGKGPPP